MIGQASFQVYLVGHVGVHTPELVNGWRQASGEENPAGPSSLAAYQTRRVGFVFGRHRS